jgi:hypothetical protein
VRTAVDRAWQLVIDAERAFQLLLTPGAAEKIIVTFDG